jgi:Actin like proteins N terminal domain
MADLCLAFDPSSSTSKALYAFSGGKLEWMTMEPEVIEVPEVGISQYETNRIGESEPHNQAWVEVKGKYYAVGFLAKNRFYGQETLRELKYASAIYKVLAMVGAIAATKKLQSQFSLSLGILLPYGEYKDRERLKKLMAEALADFAFRGQRYRVVLKSFNCLPEGAGILLRGLDASVNLKQTSVLVVMVGYRNASYLLWERGELSRGETTPLGFVRMLERVVEATSGLTTSELVAPVYQAGSQINSKLLWQVVKSTERSQQEEEVKQLVEAIKTARPQYVKMLSIWLTSRKFPKVNHVILSGGTSDYCRSELEKLFPAPQIHWGKNLEKQILKLLGKKPYLESFRSRFTDVYGYFFYLQYLLDSIVPSRSA